MDVEDSIRKFTKELNAGATSLAVLGLIAKADEPLYGYDIGTRMSGAFVNGLPMNQGALYPVLRSLERAGLLRSKIQPSSAGPPRRYYSITPKGRQVFQQWSEIWARYREGLDSILEDNRADPKHAQGHRSVSSKTRTRT